MIAFSAQDHCPTSGLMAQGSRKTGPNPANTSTTTQLSMHPQRHQSGYWSARPRKMHARTHLRGFVPPPALLPAAEKPERRAFRREAGGPAFREWNDYSATSPPICPFLRNALRRRHGSHLRCPASKNGDETWALRQNAAPLHSRKNHLAVSSGYSRGTDRRRSLIC